MLCAEITTFLVHPHDPHPELYAELEAALALLPGNQRPRAAVAYAKAALLSAGYAPQLDTCLACARPVADTPVRFSIRAGGFLCGPGNGSGCAHEHAGPLLAVPGRIIAALARLPLPTALAANLPERPADATALSTALSLLLAQIESITDKPLRTRYLLKSIFTHKPSSPATTHAAVPSAPPPAPAQK
jgi:recombinational DNA repair protein (RecF pathway)